MTVYVLNVMMNFNFVFMGVSITVFIIEMLEKTKATQALFRDKYQNLCARKVVFGRIVFIALMTMALMLVTDLRLVYALSGVMINSFVGLIIPGLVGLLRPIEIRTPDESIAWKISDHIIILLGVITQVVYIASLL